MTYLSPRLDVLLPRLAKPLSGGSCLAGIEEQIARLTEIEGLQEEWQVQAQAQDEVERLLRAQPGGI